MKGFVNINKPLGMTSSDVVVKVRSILRKASGEKQKVGHLGTLDPLGTGVLPIAIGKATRLFDFMQDKTKVYQATFVFGKETDTLDRAGKIVRTCDVIPTKEQICKALPLCCGHIDQIPPQYSAKSVGGKRAYDLAREGKQVELAPKRVCVHYIGMIEDVQGVVLFKSGAYELANNEYAFEIACSSGTYIRSIARDLAASLGTVGYMSSINRIQSGCFLSKDSVSLEDFEKDPLGYVRSVEETMRDYPVFELDGSCADKVLNGVKIAFENLPEGLFAVRYNGEIVAIGEDTEGVLHLKTRL